MAADRTGRNGRRTALFLQCTDASRYPPILNAAAMMADAGWKVAVLNSPPGDDAPIQSGPHPGVTHLATRTRQGNAVRAPEYATYLAHAIALAARLRPGVIYASDPLSALPALLAARASGAAIVYHEHDSPPPGSLRPFLARRRAAVARRARLVIAPNEDRGRLMSAELGFAQDRLRIVWNLPRQAELPTLGCRGGETLTLYYHGSITPDRLPLALAEAVARLGGAVRLRIVGYEVPGARGYVEQLLQLGRRADGQRLVEYGGAASRAGLLSLSAGADIGLALMPLTSDDLNLRHMVGASNKAFDYMASGLPLLVSDLHDWREAFVAPGFARACNPTDPDSMVEALRWFGGHESERRDMARRARAKIEADWNYDHAFAPIVASLSEVVR
ncbi:MAG TPA: glycosyltransferase [Caulobacteraceae bacterium]|jgi:glycosyltransferase involved in cell wall biosynthesis